jgi:hypothetical protein
LASLRPRGAGPGAAAATRRASTAIPWRAVTRSRTAPTPAAAPVTIAATPSATAPIRHGRRGATAGDVTVSRSASASTSASTSARRRSEGDGRAASAARIRPAVGDDSPRTAYSPRRG